MDFQYVDFVYEPGQFSIRGSIIDIFSFASDYPYRIDFFGDDVESIRSFDIENQLSKENFQKISILPNIVNPDAENAELKKTESIFNFIQDDTVIWLNNNHIFLIELKKYKKNKLNREKTNPT